MKIPRYAFDLTITDNKTQQEIVKCFSTDTINLITRALDDAKLSIITNIMDDSFKKLREGTE